MKLYGLETVLPFGKHNGRTINTVLEDKTAKEYINWCFQKLDTFCVTDEVFNKIPFVIDLRKPPIKYQKEGKQWLKKMESIHADKKEKLNIELYGELPYGRKYKFSKDEIIRREQFQNSLLDGEYSLPDEFHENGEGVAFESIYKDEKSELPYKRIGWYPEGELYSEETYNNGEIDGFSFKWDINGNLSNREQYKEGKLDGLQLCWFPNGQLQWEVLVNEGKRELQRMWDENGLLIEDNTINYGEEDYNYSNNSASYFDDTFDGDEQMQEWYWSNENN